MTNARTIEEILYDLIKPESMSIPFDELRAAFRNGNGQPKGHAEIYERVVLASEGVRHSVQSEVASVFHKWSRPQDIRLRAGEMTAQEMRSVLACLGGVEAELERELSVHKAAKAGPDVFHPSFELCKAYDRALGGLAYIPGGGERWARIWNEVRSIFISHARFIREEHAVVTDLSDGETISITEVATTIVDRLLLEPTRSDPFIKGLSQELVEFLNDGGRIAGSWGQIEVRAGKLVYVLNPVVRPDHEKSNKRTMDIKI